MNINWLEYKNKKSGLIIKKTPFQKINLFISDNQAGPLTLLTTLCDLRNFALGLDGGRFADVIARTNFQASHQEYLWFAKNTTSSGPTYVQGNLTEGPVVLVDEEELYDQQNTMLMRRGFQEVTLDGFPSPLANINQEKSMLYLLNTTPVAAPVASGFSHIYTYYLDDETALATLTLIKALPHGAVAIMDGGALTAPLNITPLLDQRPDIQIFATGCSGAPFTTLVVKGNTISCLH